MQEVKYLFVKPSGKNAIEGATIVSEDDKVIIIAVHEQDYSWMRSRLSSARAFACGDTTDNLQDAEGIARLIRAL